MVVQPGVEVVEKLRASTSPGRDTPVIALTADVYSRRPAEYAALVRHIVENGYLNGEVIRLDGGLVSLQVFAGGRGVSTGDDLVRKLRPHIDGVIAITGNHEYFYEPEAWTAHLQTLGLRFLQIEHERARLRRGFSSGSAGSVDCYGGNWTPPSMAEMLWFGPKPSRPKIVPP